MTMSLLPLILVAGLFVAACGAPGPDSAEAADSSLPPSAFALQFTGRYQGAPPLAALELRRDGTFAASDGEQGRFYSRPGRRMLPLHLLLRSRERSRTAVIDAYDGKLRTGEETLLLARPQQADEDLCDSTGGHWPLLRVRLRQLVHSVERRLRSVSCRWKRTVGWPL
jgi:hypothetical protein